MPFTAPTLAQAQDDLADRLFDPTFVHWGADELTRYLQEALRWWNAATAYWRDTASFTTIANQAFYDLATVLSTLRARTLTNWNLVTDLQFALLEPPAAGGAWTGTNQFDLTVLSTAIQRRRDQFLRDTGCVLTAAVHPYSPPPVTGRILLNEPILIVRRAAWAPDATGTIQPLMRDDEFAANAFAVGWPQSTEAPFAYSVSVTPPLTLQLIPPTSSNGDLHLLSINKGVAVNAGSNVGLGLPDDFVWAVKFGVLADLLKEDGLAHDPQRAQYCEGRYQEGVELCKRAGVVLAARIDGTTIRIGSVSDADSYEPLWQLTPGVPRELLLMSQNLLATNPRADAASPPYSIQLDVVRNAPVPVSVTNDVLQIGGDIYDSILDYAQHLALFKEGPDQLGMAMPLLARAAAAAGVELKTQQAQQPARRPLVRQTLQDREAHPKELPPVPPGE